MRSQQEKTPPSEPWLAEIAHRLRTKLVEGLLFQRRQLIQTQEVGTEQILALEARIAQLQKLHRERIQELKLRIDARDAEIRRLRRQKAALLLELETRAEPEPNNAPVVELRESGLLLRS